MQKINKLKMSDKKNQTNFEINQVINQPYKYGFTTKIENEKISNWN